MDRDEANGFLTYMCSTYLGIDKVDSEALHGFYLILDPGNANQPLTLNIGDGQAYVKF